MITIQQTRGREIEEIKPELVPVRGQMIIDTAERNFKVGDGETELLTLPWWLHKPPKEVDGGVVVWTPPPTPPQDGRYEYIHLDGKSYVSTSYSLSKTAIVDTCFSIDKPNSDTYMCLCSNNVKYNASNRAPIIRCQIVLPNTVNIYFTYAKPNGRGGATTDTKTFTIPNFKFGEKVVINTSSTMYTTVSHDGRSYNSRISIYNNSLSGSSSDGVSLVSTKMNIGCIPISSGMGEYFKGNIYYILYKKWYTNPSSGFIDEGYIVPERQDGKPGIYNTLKNVFQRFTTSIGTSGVDVGGYIPN